jgi:excisionase family DNA binding protein
MAPKKPTMTAQPQRKLTSAEARAYLNVSEWTLRRYVASGDLKAYRLGGRDLRFDISDLDALMKPVPTTGGDNIPEAS